MRTVIFAGTTKRIPSVFQFYRCIFKTFVSSWSKNCTCCLKQIVVLAIYASFHWEEKNKNKKGLAHRTEHLTYSTKPMQLTHPLYHITVPTLLCVSHLSSSFFEKVPVLANLSIRCCPVVLMMGGGGGCDGGPYTSSSMRLGVARWLTRQVVSQTADSRNTLTVDLEDNSPVLST